MSIYIMKQFKTLSTFLFIDRVYLHFFYSLIDLKLFQYIIITEFHYFPSSSLYNIHNTVLLGISSF